MRFAVINLPALALCSLLLVWQSSGANDLNDLIEGLYGGDGITLSLDPGAVIHNAHFQADSLAELAELSSGIAELSFPALSSQGGLTFEFDPVLNEFVQSTDSLGPILTERAETNGKGRFSLGVAYTYISFTEFEGEDLDNLRIELTHLGVGDGSEDNGYKFKRDVVVLDLEVELESQVFSIFGTYGVLDQLDVGFLLPIIRNELDVRSFGSVRVDESLVLGHPNFPDGFHSFDNAIDPANDSASGSDTGIGDLLLRSKYNFQKSGKVKMSAALEVRLPTGDPDNFRGLHRAGIKPSLIFSSGSMIGDTFVSPHANLGFDVNAGTEGQEEIDYAVGVDWTRKVGDDLFTFGVDVVGSSEVTNKDGIGDDILDLSVGLKWNFFNQQLFFASLQSPLNSDGLRADVVSTFGYEVTF